MKQPSALYPLSLTELWERFGFYINQGLLVFFLTNFLGYSDKLSYTIMGEFTALVYISPILGGYLADKLIGFRYSVLFGGILLCLGYALLALTQTESMYWALAVIILGNGFLKPNISSYLGEFYNENDHRRDAGFTIFYMGINLGVILSTLSSGYIQAKYGWHVVYLCASGGMLFGIITYLLGFGTYGNKGLPIKVPENKVFLKQLGKPVIFLGAMALCVVMFYTLVKYATAGQEILTIFGVLLFASLFGMSLKLPVQARNRLIALLVLILASIVFWAMFFQLFLSFNLLIERGVNRVIFGKTIPPVAFISLEAIFIFMLGPVFAVLWKRLSQKNHHMPYALRFGLAMFATAIGLALIWLALHLSGGTSKISPIWIVFAYLFVTIGELLLSPVGLAMITKLSPSQNTGMLMGVWFMALGFGGALAGVLAKYADIPKGMTALSEINAIYDHALVYYIGYSILAGVILLILTPWIRKLATS